MTTLIRPRNFALATDRPVVSPRFAPGLSTTHGGVPTGDPDVSPDQTFPGWLPQFARSSHAIRMSPSALGARADGHTGTTPSPTTGSPTTWLKVNATIDLDGAFVETMPKGRRCRSPSTATSPPPMVRQGDAVLAVELFLDVLSAATASPIGCTTNGSSTRPSGMAG